MRRSLGFASITTLYASVAPAQDLHETSRFEKTAYILSAVCIFTLNLYIYFRVIQLKNISSDCYWCKVEWFAISAFMFGAVLGSVRRAHFLNHYLVLGYTVCVSSDCYNTVLSRYPWAYSSSIRSLSDPGMNLKARNRYASQSFRKVFTLILKVELSMLSGLSMMWKSTVLRKVRIALCAIWTTPYSPKGVYMVWLADYRRFIRNSFLNKQPCAAIEWAPGSNFSTRSWLFKIKVHGGISKLPA